jgi:hypothetical protein
MTDHDQTLLDDHDDHNDGLALTPSGVSSAYNSVAGSQLAQDLKNGSDSPSVSLTKIWHSFITGPMATSVKNQADATSNEFGNLAGARAPPSHTAANETPLTRTYLYPHTRGRC